MSVVTFVFDDTSMGQKLSKRCIILGGDRFAWRSRRNKNIHHQYSAMDRSCSSQMQLVWSSQRDVSFQQAVVVLEATCICNRETSKLYGSTCLRPLSMVQYGSKTLNGIDRLTEWSSHEVLYPTGSSNVAIQSRQEVLIHPPSNYTYIYLSVYICLCIYRCIYICIYIYTFVYVCIYIYIYIYENMYGTVWI